MDTLILGQIELSKSTSPTPLPTNYQIPTWQLALLTAIGQALIKAGRSVDDIIDISAEPAEDGRPYIRVVLSLKREGV